MSCTHCGEVHPASYTHCPKTGKPLSTGEALVGRVIADRYKVVGLLGEGGMGAVYIAEHTLIGRKVALKRLHPELASDARSVARFQREARAAAATGHENIVEVLDLGFAEDGAPFLVMELLKGRSLALALRREGRLAPARACHIMGQVLAALAAVHQKQIVHRDLKPDNILLMRRAGRSDYVKVLDFGVSKMRREEDDALDLTRTGVMLGTPYYMSPEQARGVKQLDHRVDLYATGVILYECLTGQLPFDGRNYHALLQAILAGDPPSLTELVPDLDGSLAAVVHRAISKDPNARFQSARQMLKALVPHGAVDPGDEEFDLDDSDELPSILLHATTPMSGPDRSQRQPPTRHTPRARPWDADTEHGPGLTSRPRTTPDPEEPEIASIASRLPRPTSIGGPPRPFRAQSSDWIDEPARALPEPSGVREAANRYTSRSSPPLFNSSPPPASPPAEPGYRISEPPNRLATGNEAHVKGALLLTATEHIEQRYGRPAVDRVVAEMPLEIRTRVPSVVLPVAWFPLELYASLLSGAERVLGNGDGSVAQAIGEYTAARELPTTHRLFLEDASPLAAVERIPQLWRAYHSRGSCTVHRVTGGGCRVVVHDLSPESYLHAMAMCGFYRKLLELTGASDVRVALLSSRGRGDERTVTSLRWK